MRCEMMTAGPRCVVGLGSIDVNVHVDEDDSLMLREEWRTKGQQSFTTRFRRDKLTVIYSRIRSRSSKPWVWTWTRPRLGMHQHPPWQAQLAFGHGRFGFKKQPSQTSLASLSLHPISDARGQCMLAVPSAIRGCPHFCVAKP